MPQRARSASLDRAQGFPDNMSTRESEFSTCPPEITLSPAEVPTIGISSSCESFSDKLLAHAQEELEIFTCNRQNNSVQILHCFSLSSVQGV